MTPDDPRYDDETVTLVAANLPMLGSWHREAESRQILTALADAGLLLPPGATTETEWSIFVGNLFVPLGHGRALVSGHPSHRRTVFKTPWTEVTDA